MEEEDEQEKPPKDEAAKGKRQKAEGPSLGGEGEDVEHVGTSKARDIPRNWLDDRPGNWHI